MKIDTRNGNSASDVLNRMAAYELLLRVADCKMKLYTIALNAEIEKLSREGTSRERRERETPLIPLGKGGTK